MNSTHYVCHGGCNGVSNKSGSCQAHDCDDYGQALHECHCKDGHHEIAIELDEHEDEE